MDLEIEKIEASRAMYQPNAKIVEANGRGDRRILGLSAAIAQCCGEMWQSDIRLVPVWASRYDAVLPDSNH